MEVVEKSNEKPIISELNGATKLKAVQSPTASENDIIEPIVYDYMKYTSKKKGKPGNAASKIKKHVTFKRIVELVTFTDDWKMLSTESVLRTEDEQRKNTNLRRNF